MEKMCRCCMLAVVFVAAVQVHSLTGLKMPDVVKSNRITTVEDMRKMSPRHRSRRAVTLSETEKTTIVDKHNALRRLAGASNMEHMKWNSYLADMAANWADGCKWGHGQPSRDENTMPYKQLGQNLYLTSANTINLDGAIQAWYDEKGDYNYDTRACSGVCGHYTQVVWDETREVGCAYSQCGAMTDSTIKSGTYLVCNYGPAGNYPRQPYIKGDVCTACPSGKGWCDNGLCRRDCTAPSDTCECKAQCANCGVVSQSTCTCTCKKGWLGADCRRECKDYDTKCGGNPGWPKSWCTDDQYPWVAEKCPLLCGLCEIADAGATCDQTKTIATSPTTTTMTTTTKVPAQTGSTTTTKAPRTATSTTAKTTTTTAVDPCAGVTCKNGGTAAAQNSECKCRCSADWQGTHCEESRAEAKIGVVLRIRAPIGIWDMLWGFIEPIIVRAINGYCNSHVSVCCPGVSVTSSTTDREYLTAAQLKVGAGYPQSLVSRGSSYTLALIYAGAAPNNALCAWAGGARKRRAVDTGSSLPQDVLLNAVNNVKGNLTEEMSRCCNATFDAVSAAVVATNEPDSGGWGVAVVADVTVVAMLAVATIAAVFWPGS